MGAELRRAKERACHSACKISASARTGSGLVVDFLDFGSDLHRSATCAVIISVYVDKSTCGKIRVQCKFFAAKEGDACIEDFVEIMWQDFT